MDNSRRAAQEDARFRLLQALEQNPEATQRELAAALGLSLGAINYSLKALGERGLVKLGNFIRSARKLAYAYVLTPAGLAEKAGLARRFMARNKPQEYEALRKSLRASGPNTGILRRTHDKLGFMGLALGPTGFLFRRS